MKLKLVTALTMLVGILSASMLLGWVARFPTVVFLGIGVIAIFAMNIRYLRRGWGMLDIYPDGRYRALLLTTEALCIILALVAMMS